MHVRDSSRVSGNASISRQPGSRHMELSVLACYIESCMRVWQCISEQDSKTNVILAGSTSCLYQLRMQCLLTRAYHFVLVDLCQLCRLLFPNWTWFWFTVWGQRHCSSLCV